MNRAALVCAACLLPAGAAAAPVFSYGPIVGRGETAAQMIVKWGTQASGATTLYYRPSGTTQWSTATGDSSVDHEVVLGGLSPGSTYEYAFDTIEGTFATLSTCPAAGAPIDVVLYGDNRPPFLGTSQHPMVIAAVSAQAPDLIINSGDLSFAGSANELESGLLPQLQPLVRSTPYMASPGNHDVTLGLEANYGRYVPTPRAQGEPWRAHYAFVCSNAMFIALNSNDVASLTQLSFLQNKLAAAQADAGISHVFVYFHHAPYSVGSHGDDAAVKSTWVPLFDAAPKVAAVFSGHDHNYARFDNGGHVAYLVSGGAGADLYNDDGTSSATKVVSRKAYHFIKLHVAGATATIRAVDLQGQTIEMFDVSVAAPPDMAGPVDLAGPSTGVDGGIPPEGGDGGDDGGGCGFAPGPAGPPSLIFALAGLAMLARGRRRT